MEMSFFKNRTQSISSGSSGTCCEQNDAGSGRQDELERQL